MREKTQQTEPLQDDARQTENRNISRILTVLDTLAKAPTTGLRLTDVAERTKLGKTTAHRLLGGLVANSLVEQDEDSGRYFVGLKILSWAAAVKNRFGFTRLAEPALERIAQRADGSEFPVEAVLWITRADGVAYTTASMRDLSAARATALVIERQRDIGVDRIGEKQDLAAGADGGRRRRRARRAALSATTDRRYVRTSQPPARRLAPAPAAKPASRSRVRWAWTQASTRSRGQPT